MLDVDGADDTGQGAKREYPKRPDEWQAFDPTAFDALRSVPRRPTLQDLRRAEGEGLIPGATYFEAPTPDKAGARAGWHARCLTAFAGVDLAFFDPDNGLEIVARPRGRKHSNKYAFVDELANQCRASRSILLYQHYPRHKPRAEVTASACARLEAAMQGATTRTLARPFAAFLLASRPKHQSRAAQCFAEMKRCDRTPRFFASA